MEHALKKAGETAPIAVDLAAFRLTAGGALFELEPAYRRYRAADEGARAAVLREYAALHRAQPGLRGEAWADARPFVLPRLVSRAEASLERLRAPRDPEPIERRL